MCEKSFVKRPGLNIRNVDQETVIVDKETGEVHQLNPTASFIWDQFNEGVTVAQVASTLIAEFGISEQQSESDVNAVVEQLISLKLLIHKDK